MKCDRDMQNLEKNRDIYDHADDRIWYRAVYEPVHNGQHFANIGGQGFLDLIAERCKVSSGNNVLDICCGSGAAACYLASSYGCSITGIDINGSQVQRARQRGHGISGLRFLEADACKWTPDRSYDVVFALDSVTLISDLEGLFRNCLTACRPGGRFALAEVVARDRLSEEMRRFALEEDGAVRLESVDRLVALVEGAGFGDTEIVDLDEKAVRAFTTIHDSVCRSADWFDVPQEKIAEWKILAKRYLSAFESGELGYVGIVAAAL
jgi:SAM-dependent methyltransferase